MTKAIKTDVVVIGGGPAGAASALHLLERGVTPLLIEREEFPRVTAYKQVTGAYGFVHRMIRLFYNPHAVTWAEVGVEGEAHRQHESAMAAGHYMLSGDFFENFEKYHRFFELLEDPEGFRRYKKFVIDRPRLNDVTCHTAWETAFADMAEMDAQRSG